MKFIGAFTKKPVDKIQILLNLGKMTGALREGQHTFMIIYP
jgi:hypothetical protein